MKIELPPIKNHPPYDFSKLIKTIETNILKLRNGSNRKPSSFNDDIRFFREHWLENEEPVTLSTSQLRSVSIHLIESEISFKQLLEVELLPELLSQMEKEENISIKKRVIQFYFTHYFLIEEYKVDIRSSVSQVLKKYKGHNYFMQIYKTYLNNLLDPISLLIKFKCIEEIWKTFNLSPNSDFYKYLLILDFVNQLKSIEPDKSEKDVFKKINSYKDFSYDKHILIGEYTVRVLIEKMMQSPNYDYTEWVNFIIDLVGDPRTVSAYNAQNVSWNRIGEKYRKFLVGFLSKEDLVLFLEVLSDPEYDNVYRYRKAFWKPFVKHLRYAKLFINNSEFERLEEPFKQRFTRRDNSSYSFISDSKRSFIYMDFGKIKVIEGTHNAKVRLYSDTPISLENKYYDYQDFYKTDYAKQLIIEEVTHSHSEIGTWQNKVFNILKEHIPNIKITLRETLLQ